MRRIYLFRHGEVEASYQDRYCGHRDAALSPEGMAQNRSVGKFAERVQAALFSSDLQRTWKGLGADASRVGGLREISFGAWEGLSWEEIEKKYPAGAAAYLESPAEFTFPGGESFAAFSKRVSASFESVRTSGSAVVIVTHAGVLRALLSALFSIPLKETFRFTLGYSACIALRESSAGVLYLEGIRSKAGRNLL